MTLSVAYPRKSQWKKAAKYAGIGAVIVVLAIVVISVVAMRVVAGLLSDAAIGLRAASAPLICWRWLEARRKVYEGQVNPATGQPYTRCEAAEAAISEAESGEGWAPCPADSDSSREPGIYTYYASAQC